jgi:hypothetical protein
MEAYFHARLEFEGLMDVGIRPMIYHLKRTAGGEYVSYVTEHAWKDFLLGWIAAGGKV